jgi:c-di-GMP-binding flagellar brake protein YcgR
MEKREFFRVDAAVPMSVRQINAAEASRCSCCLSGQEFDKNLKNGLFRKINISGAGIYFENASPYSLDDHLELHLMLGDVHPGIVILYAKVVRVERGPKNYCIAVKYEGMDEEMREIILKYVFQRERILIQEKRVGWL